MDVLSCGVIFCLEAVLWLCCVVLCCGCVLVAFCRVVL